MTVSSLRRPMLLVLAVSLAATLMIARPTPGRVSYLTLVACPSIHPYRPNVGLKYGETEAMDRRPGKEFGGSPVSDAPPDRYASDGWVYEIQEAFHVVEYLVCVYADDSKVSYPLPDFKLRGTGRCDFVREWTGQNFDGEFIRDWPYGLERKPMALCTFDYSARRIVPALRTN